MHIIVVCAASLKRLSYIYLSNICLIQCFVGPMAHRHIEPIRCYNLESWRSWCDNEIFMMSSGTFSSCMTFSFCTLMGTKSSANARKLNRRDKWAMNSTKKCRKWVWTLRCDVCVCRVIMMSCAPFTICRFSYLINWQYFPWLASLYHCPRSDTGGHRERAELLCIAIIHTIFVFRCLHFHFAAFA